jgi:hypothetical protein
MAVIATDSTRFSAVVKHEYEPQTGYCREVVTMNDAAATIKVGTVLGAYVTTPTGTASAKAGNTGNGVMGAITVASVPGLILGTYKVAITEAVANAGKFVLIDPQGDVVGSGNVAVLFNQAGISFTLADGATDFVVGDGFNIVVAGTVKYKVSLAAATDGTQVPSAVYIADNTGNSGDLALAANTDTKVLVLARGPAIVADAALTLGTGTTAAVAKAGLQAVNILVETAL